MKKFLLFILVSFFGLTVFSQSVVPIRADTVVIYKQGGYANLRLQNSTANLKGGVIYNIDGKGTFAFIHSRKSGDTLFVGGDTILNIGGGGGPGSGDTLYVQSGIYAPDDSTIRLGVNPLLENVTIDGQSLYTFTFGSTRVLMNSTRFEETMGSSTAAANNLTLGLDGNLFTITGSTQINAITTANWQAGSTIAFVFTDTPRLKHNTAGGAGTAVMLLSANTDYLAAAGDYIAFRYDGTSWHETSRRLASGGSVHGIDDVLAVGQALTLPRTIDVGTTNQLIIQGNLPTGALAGTLKVTNNDATGIAIQGNTTGTGGVAVEATATNGFGIYSLATTGTALRGTSTSGPGLVVQTNTGIPAQFFQVNTSDNSSVIDLMDIMRLTATNGVNGIGGKITYWAATSSNGQITNELVSKWTNATLASRVSQFIITGVDNAVTGDKFTLDGNGNITTVGGYINHITTQGGGTYTIAANDWTVIGTGTTSTWTFPTATTGRVLNLVNHGTGAITYGTAITTANGTTTTTSAAGNKDQIQYDGSVWRKIN